MFSPEEIQAQLSKFIAADLKKKQNKLASNSNEECATTHTMTVLCGGTDFHLYRDSISSIEFLNRVLEPGQNFIYVNGVGFAYRLGAQDGAAEIAIFKGEKGASEDKYSRSADIVDEVTGASVHDTAAEIVRLIKLRLETEKEITINLVGWSRGAMTAFEVARLLHYNTDKQLAGRYKINICAFDPVAGPQLISSVSNVIEVTPNIASAEVFYCLTEERLLFQPAVFKGGTKNKNNITIHSLPGSHADLVKAPVINNDDSDDLKTQKTRVTKSTDIANHIMLEFCKRNGVKLSAKKCAQERQRNNKAYNSKMKLLSDVEVLLSYAAVYPLIDSKPGFFSREVRRNRCQWVSHPCFMNKHHEQVFKRHFSKLTPMGKSAPQVADPEVVRQKQALTKMHVEHETQLKAYFRYLSHEPVENTKAKIFDEKEFKRFVLQDLGQAHYLNFDEDTVLRNLNKLQIFFENPAQANNYKFSFVIVNVMYQFCVENYNIFREKVENDNANQNTNKSLIAIKAILMGLARYMRKHQKHFKTLFKHLNEGENDNIDYAQRAVTEWIDDKLIAWEAHVHLMLLQSFHLTGNKDIFNKELKITISRIQDHIKNSVDKLSAYHIVHLYKIIDSTCTRINKALDNGSQTKMDISIAKTLKCLVFHIGRYLDKHSAQYRPINQQRHAEQKKQCVQKISEVLTRLKGSEHSKPSANKVRFRT